MAKSEYVLNIGDDNVVLTKIVDGQVANAWLASPDPAMATEELGEALAEDPKCKISMLTDTLDQTFREEEIPKVNVLDRRRVLGRHVNMAFPGANLRGARQVETDATRTLLYQFAAVPIEGRLQGWIEFFDSLPNEKGGFYAIASEYVDLIEKLAPADEPPPEVEEQEKPKGKDKDKDAAPAKELNRWRHLIGVNATGGLRQIISKNGRLSLTRLTQAPPPDTPPGEFADMISRDFKATITYIRRLGYAVGEPLDLVILTTEENKGALKAVRWEGTHSVSVFTPYEAAMTLGLGSIGREDQAFCDVLYSAYFAAKPKKLMPLSWAAVIGDIKDDLRELAFIAAPFAAAFLAVMLFGWTLWTSYDTYAVGSEIGTLSTQEAQLKRSLQIEKAALDALHYDAALVRNVIGVSDTMEIGRIDLAPILRNIASALQSDAVVVSFNFAPPGVGSGVRGPNKSGAYVVAVRMRLADVIVKADEAVQIARKLGQRLTDVFGKDYKVEMVAEPATATSKRNQAVTGNLLGGPVKDDSQPSKERFYTEFKISKGGS
jgi:hypothetical protein